MFAAGRRSVWLLAAAVSVSGGAALAQNIPGQVPIYGTYAGSVEQQRRDAESARQNWPQAGQSQPSNGASSSGGGGGSSGPARPAPPPIDWAKRPPLAATRNPVLGRWQPGKVDVAAIANEVSPLAGKAIGGFLANEFGGFLQGTCDEDFGDKVIEFNAAGMVSQGPDGRAVVTPLAYRADGNNVVAVRGGNDDVIRFTFEGRNKVEASGCPMSRVGAGQTASLTAGGPGAASRPAPPPVATITTLEFNVGAAAPGRFNPLAGANLFVLPGDPDAALARAGFGGAPVETWLKTCKTNSQSCTAGFQAMTAGAIANVKTDAAGHAQLPTLPQGRYFIFGMVAYEGHSLIWHRPVTIQPGPNAVFLDQTTATAG